MMQACHRFWNHLALPSSVLSTCTNKFDNMYRLPSRIISALVLKVKLLQLREKVLMMTWTKAKFEQC